MIVDARSDLTLINDGEFIWAADTVKLAAELVRLEWSCEWTTEGDYHFIPKTTDKDGDVEAYTALCNAVDEAVDQTTLRIIHHVQIAAYSNPGPDVHDQKAYDELDPALVARVNSASGFTVEPWRSRRGFFANEEVATAFVNAASDASS